MKKPTRRIEEPPPRNIQRADIAPANGYAIVIDGHFKTQFSEEGAAKDSNRITGKISDAANRNLRRYGEEPNIDKKALAAFQPFCIYQNMLANFLSVHA